jgi:hypothetical protein
MAAPELLDQLPQDRPIIFEDPSTHDLIVRIYGDESLRSRRVWNDCLRQSMKMKGFIRDDVHHHRDGKLEVIEQYRISLTRFPGIRSFIAGFCRCYWCTYVTGSESDSNLQAVPQSILKLGEGQYRMYQRSAA